MVVSLEIIVERLRPVGVHDGGAALGVRHVLIEAEPVPEFLGDERHERMEQAQGVGEDEIEHREGVGFLGLFAAVEHSFARAGPISRRS